MQFEITRPFWLAALAILPLLVYYRRRSLVQFARWQRATSLVIRVLLVVVLVLALCGIKTTGTSRQEVVVFAAGRPENEVHVSALEIPVLLIEGRPNCAEHLESALKNEHFHVEVRPPQEMPRSLDGLRNHELLMLANVPAKALGPESITVIETIETYVKQGGGLIVIGGDQSLTAGDYHDTRLEELLPVACRVNLAMVLMIDQSGSMKKQDRIGLAKQAGKKAVNMLGPRDMMGVIAFTDKANWICNIQPCSDEQKKRVCQQIDEITSLRERTDLYSAMKEAHRALRESLAELKHVIVLTDGSILTEGLTDSSDFEALIRDIVKSGITVSTVAVGKEADLELLQKLAQIEQVDCYYRDDPAAVPEVFARDIEKRISAGKLGIIQGPFVPKVVNPAEVPADLELQEMPSLSAYVETRPKKESRIVLASANGDPLLVWMRCGLGLSVAFTSDVQGPWAEHWPEWPGFATFWTQLVRHAMRKDESGDFLMQVEQKNDRAQVILDATDPDGKYLNGAGAALTIVDPEGTRREEDLRQVAPGRYAADFRTPTAGDYSLAATFSHRRRSMYVPRRKLVVGYAGDGQSDPQAGEVFATSERIVPCVTFLWPYLLVAAALVFVIDVALKRIDLTPKGPPERRKRHWSDIEKLANLQ